MDDAAVSRRRWLALAVGAAAGAGVVAALPASALFVPGDTATALVSGERWACPMLDFLGTGPGACPVCGMKMERMTAGDLSREQARRMGVEVVAVTAGPARVAIHAAGAVEYDERRTRLVIPRISGRIVKRHEATWGCCQEVAAGEPVVDLYSTEALLAQSELQSALRRGDGSVIAGLRNRFARWNLEPVAAAILAGGEPVDTVTITTPFTGQVLMQDQKMVNETLLVGKEIKSDEPLLRVVDPDALTVVAHVPEKHAWMLREGTPVELRSDDRGLIRNVDARISRVGNEINPEIRTVEIRCHLTGARSQLRPGSLVTLRIRAVLGPDERPADQAAEATWGQFTLIPKAAVLSTGVRDVAWRLAERNPDGSQRFAIAPLDLGPRIEDNSGDWYVVRSGLKPGDQVAAQGAFLIDAQAQLAGSPSLLNPTGMK